MPPRKTNGDVKAAIALGIFFILLSLMLGDSSIGAVLGLFVFALAVYAMTRVPIRTSMLTLMAGVFIVENPLEGFASGQWESPFRTPGSMLVNHLNTIDRTLTETAWMSFSGLDMCFAALGCIAWSRRISRSRIDGEAGVPTPQPLLRLALVSLLGALFVLIIGLFHGGEMGKALWQLDRVVYLPVVFYLFQYSIRVPADLMAVGKVILMGGMYRAMLATYIASVTPKTLNEFGVLEGIPCATTHHDSMLFAACLVILLTLVTERAIPRATRVVFTLAPVIMLGMVNNNRRMAWVQVAAAFLTIYFVSADNPIKQRLRRTLLLSTPLILLYIVIGWGRPSKIFKPVAMMRSVVDAESNGSSFWREIENFNLVSTMRANPILGTGYGIPYTEYITMPAVDYPLEYILPHNSLLALWSFGGYIGYTALTLLWAGGVYFAMRAYHAATDGLQRASAQVCFGIVFIYMIQCWGDLGLGTWCGVFLMGASMAVSGKLAVINGQWDPATKRASPFSIV